MKKYTKQITETKSRLIITNDDNNDSPRNDSNLGYFITCDRHLQSPDREAQMERIVSETGNRANNIKEHIKMIKKELSRESAIKVIAIYPVTKYEHKNVSYSLGTVNGFDNSNNGFYIVTDKTQKETGTPKKSFEKVIREELNVYNKFINGEILRFELFDEQGEYLDSCGGFYDIESIRSYLPKEWKKENLTDYII